MLKAVGILCILAGSTGLGDGRAAIGAHCYVLAATALPVSLSAVLTLSDPDAQETATAAISEAVTGYLADLPFRMHRAQS